jgi:hypothetical protein
LSGQLPLVAEEQQKQQDEQRAPITSPSLAAASSR